MKKVFLRFDRWPLRRLRSWRRISVFICCSLLYFLLSLKNLPAQNKKDIGDLISTHDPAALSEPKIKKLYLPILPIIGYAPANGFILGAGMAPAILLDSLRHTRVSNALANVQLTSRQQLNFNLRHYIYLSRDRWIFQGDWRVLFFSQPTYGLGMTEVPAAFSLNGLALQKDNPTNKQPMRFTYVRLYETALRRLNGSWYGGVGFAADFHRAIEDELLNTGPPEFFTSHFLYSNARGFSNQQYQTIGATGKLVLDTRDNAISAYRGLYLDASVRTNTRWFGSSANSQQLSLDFRNYQRLGRAKQILAFWFLGQFLMGGELPYLALPSLGWDNYNRSGRGYVQGRFRGESMVYSEMEYRFNISRSELLGGVIFANMTTTNNPLARQSLFERAAWGYGAGLRVKMNKETRTNICIDLGFGASNSSGVYFGIQEAF